MDMLNNTAHLSITTKEFAFEYDVLFQGCRNRNIPLFQLTTSCYLTNQIILQNDR